MGAGGPYSHITLILLSHSFTSKVYSMEFFYHDRHSSTVKNILTGIATQFTVLLGIFSQTNTHN